MQREMKRYPEEGIFKLFTLKLKLSYIEAKAGAVSNGCIPKPTETTLTVAKQGAAQVSISG